MRSPRLLLVGNDPQLMQDICLTLNEATVGRYAVCDFDSARQHLDSRTSRVLVFAAKRPEDIAPITALARELHLRRWPVSVCLVTSEAVGRHAALDQMERYGSPRLYWPSDAANLTELPALRQQVRADRAHSTNGASSSTADSLARALVGQTPSLERLIEPLTLAASHDVNVLLTGPTGTGKTFLARLIHEHSARAQHRMLVVPCGALAPNLIESELFGHAKGAFTGAVKAKVGKFEAVGAGTLLLDEIDTLTVEHQAKLLRVIETGAYEAVGSNETSICKARIIAASNWDLKEAVSQNRFREDLYYRLNVLAIHLEPLANRPEDIGPMARSLVAEFSNKFQKEIFDIEDEAIAALQAFPWPGNIRQLENAIQQAVLVSTGPVLQAQHLPRSVREHATSMPIRIPPPGSTSASSLVENRDQHEKAIIELALRDSRNCRSRAANALGISRATLYNKMKKFGIPRVRTY